MTITIGGQPAPDDVKRALEFAGELLEYLDEMPDAASDFAESVEEKTRGIMANIQRMGRVTEGQWTALENMRDGAERWEHGNGD